MFGTYEEKHLKSMPRTFTPKDPEMSAREKKSQFLRSEVLPFGAQPKDGYQQQSQQPRESFLRCGQQEQPGWVAPEGEAEIDTGLRRQQEVASNLFGRATPKVTTEQANDRSVRLTPNNFQWHNHPRAVCSPPTDQSLTHEERAYHEKCSGLFDHSSPQGQIPPPEYRVDGGMRDAQGDSKRHYNAQYSDLFGHPTPMEAPPANQERRAKYQGSFEDKVVIHSDWTDSRTENLGGIRPQRPEHPSLRKSDELHQTRIFSLGECGSGAYRPLEKLSTVAHDNSDKLRSTIGCPTQQIHQAHLRTSTTPSDFYEVAESSQQWEVVELHISGLSSDCDDRQVRTLCKGCDLQIVKAKAEMDPVRNLCMGRGKIMVRYNPEKDSMKGLVQRLEQTNLKVEV